MFNKKHNALLKKASERFENASYVDGNFMVEHDISYDDGASLLAEMAMILNGFCRAPKEVQMAICVAGVMPDDRAGKLAFCSTRDNLRIQALMQKIATLDFAVDSGEIDCYHWFE